MPEQRLAGRTLHVFGKSQTVRRPVELPLEARPAGQERQRPKILAVRRQEVESDEAGLLLARGGQEPVEVWKPVRVEAYGLPIDQEIIGVQCRDSRHDRLEVGLPASSVAGPYLHAAPVLADHHAEAVVLNLVDPLGPGWDLAAKRRLARLDEALRRSRARGERINIAGDILAAGLKGDAARCAYARPWPQLRSMRRVRGSDAAF